MVCPKCGAKIARFDLAPNCKQCGVHIMYYTQEQDLARDAKKCELEFASLRIRLENVKLAFYKERLALVRLLIIFVGAGCLFIPYTSLSAELPFWSQKITVSALGVYGIFADGLLMQIPNLLGADWFPEISKLLLASLIIFAAAFLALLGVFATMVLGFLNLQKSCRIMNRFAVIAAVLCVAGAVTGGCMQALVSQSAILSANLGAGYFVMLALLIALVTVNVLLYRKNPLAQIREIDLQRVDMLKKVKMGEVSYDDLPLPVFYSEEEQAARMQILGERKKKNKKGGASNG